MPPKLRFSVKGHNLQSIYNVLQREPTPQNTPFFYSVEQVDPDDGDESDREEDIVVPESGCVHMKAQLHTAPFDPDWQRVELWGRNCRPEGNKEGTFGFEVAAGFGSACKVYVPHTSDINFYENRVVWWDFPFTRPNGAPIFARNILFVFGEH